MELLSKSRVLSMKLNFFINDREFEAHINEFPSGELGVVIPEINLARAVSVRIVYDWRLLGNNGIIVVAQLLEALRSKFKFIYFTELVMPYVPYSRQDRVCNVGESFSLKVFANIINDMGFNQVTTWDNHSDVATALIDNCFNIHQRDILDETLGADGMVGYTLVSPDAGSVKKTQAIAKEFGITDIVYADKVRDVSTGQITSIDIRNPELVRSNMHFLVVDDICDGGGTFLGLGSAMRDLNEQCHLNLFITHGFFTKGTSALYGIYDNIYTTDSVYQSGGRVEGEGYNG